MTDSVLALDHVTRILTKEIIPVTLVNDVSCRIAAGEFVAITGASGSGKSSLLYLMGLLDQPTSGRVILDGEEMTAASEQDRQKARLEKIGFVFQFHFLLQEFSALDNLLLPMQKNGVWSAAEMIKRAEHLLASLGLAKAGHKKPWQMSGGERQRVAIARALANKPRLILADEPTGNLDSKNAAAVNDIFREIALAEKTAVVTVTHNTEFADTADRRIVMVDGKIVEQ